MSSVDSIMQKCEYLTLRAKAHMLINFLDRDPRSNKLKDLLAKGDKLFGCK